MTSKEALERLYSLVCKFSPFLPFNLYEPIKQDLDRLEQLEKENQELKETLNKTRKMGLETIEENEQLSNELHKLNCYRNIELNEISKLKQSLDILKRLVGVNSIVIFPKERFVDITQKEFELLKEVLDCE